MPQLPLFEAVELVIMKRVIPDVGCMRMPLPVLLELPLKIKFFRVRSVTVRLPGELSKMPL